MSKTTATEEANLRHNELVSRKKIKDLLIDLVPKLNEMSESFDLIYDLTEEDNIQEMASMFDQVVTIASLYIEEDN